MSIQDTVLFENAYIETKEMLADRETELKDGDILPLQEEFKINLIAGALHFVNTYGGRSEFIRSLKVQLVKKGSLTIPQIRGALNALRNEVRADEKKLYSREGEVAPIQVTAVQATGPVQVPTAYVPVPEATNPLDGVQVQDASHPHVCYKCGRFFTSVRTVMDHKSNGRCVPQVKETAGVVNQERSVKTFLDLMPLPNGCYAFPRTHGAGDKDFLYLQVRTLTRPMREDRRYKYGKIVHGNEWIPAGTIQVRQWSGDTKELVGMQRPGEGYDGQFVEELIQIMSQPQFCAQIFAAKYTRCYICAKTLNDDISIALQIGPDCQQKYGLDYMKNFHRTVAVPPAQP